MKDIYSIDSIALAVVMYGTAMLIGLSLYPLVLDKEVSVSSECRVEMRYRD